MPPEERPKRRKLLDGYLEIPALIEKAKRAVDDVTRTLPPPPTRPPLGGDERVPEAVSEAPSKAVSEAGETSQQPIVFT